MEYNILTSRSAIRLDEIYKAFEKFNIMFHQKTQESIETNKKLLVILGETHHSQESLFWQLAILTHLSNKGFNSLLVETREDALATLKEILKEYTITKLLNYIYAQKVLGMELSAIDPLSLGDLNESLASTDADHQSRTDKINIEIAMQAANDQVAIIGAHHLDHLLNSAEINEKFVIMPILAEFSISKHPKKVQQLLVGKVQELYNLAKKDTITLDFKDSIESFSLAQLLEIHQEMLPYYLGIETSFKEKTYYSEFPEDTSNCPAFVGMPELIKFIESSMIPGL